MADTKTSAEPAAVGLIGSELLWGVQSGGNVKITPEQLATFISGAGKDRIVAAATPQASHTGDTVEFTFATITVPGGLLGPNGRLEAETMWSYTNNANTKTLRVKLGSAAFVQLAPTTSQSQRHSGALINDGAQNSQIGFNAGTSGGFSTANAAIPTYAVDTSVSQSLTITGQLANAADSIKLESYLVRAIYVA